MEPVPTCPLWWPHMLWHLHFPPGEVLPHGGGGGGSPINKPPEINRILIALASYTLTYQLEGSEQVGRLRAAARDEVIAAATALTGIDEFK